MARGSQKLEYLQDKKLFIRFLQRILACGSQWLAVASFSALSEVRGGALQLG